MSFLSFHVCKHPSNSFVVCLFVFPEKHNPLRRNPEGSHALCVTVIQSDNLFKKITSLYMFLMCMPQSRTTETSLAPNGQDDEKQMSSKLKRSTPEYSEDAIPRINRSNWGLLHDDDCRANKNRLTQKQKRWGGNLNMSKYCSVTETTKWLLYSGH